jgi:hypothetical protein
VLIWRRKANFFLGSLGHITGVTGREAEDFVGTPYYDSLIIINIRSVLLCGKSSILLPICSTLRNELISNLCTGRPHYLPSLLRARIEEKF